MRLFRNKSSLGYESDLDAIQLLSAWLPLAVTISVFVGLTLAISTRDIISRYYVLSSISQGLAAVFALVFTITLVTAQILSKYSVKTTRVVFSKWTIALMFVYAGGILGPLLVMQWQNELLFDISIIWATTCIFILIPYFLYIRNCFEPRWHVEFLLKDINSDYVEHLKKIYEERTLNSEDNPLFELDETGGRYWFNVQNDPLMVILQIMMKTLKEGEYETFIFSLNSIRKKYQLVANKDNVKYLAYHFINVLNRSGREIIREKQDFLLIQLCDTLRDIAEFNMNEGLPGINTKISYHIVEFLKAAYLQEDFRCIVLDATEIIEDIGTKYARKSLEYEFKNQAKNLCNVSLEIGREASPDELDQFMRFILGLVKIAVSSGPSFADAIRALAESIRNIGIECARRHSEILRKEQIESKLSQWSTIYLEDIKNEMIENERFSQENLLVEALVSDMETYISNVRDAQLSFED